MHKGFLFVAMGILVAVAASASSMRAQTATVNEPYDPNVSYDCDRACLTGFIDQYLAALVAHDPSRLPLARDVKFTENDQVMKLGDGLWGTANGLGSYKIYAADPETGEVMFMGVVKENGASVILGLRLRIQTKKIMEIEQMVDRSTPGRVVHADALADNPDFNETLPPPDRRSRQNMIAIANVYYSAIEKNDGTMAVPFDKSCIRIENGNQTTSNPNLRPNAAPGALNVPAMSCEEQIKLGAWKEDTWLRDRRFVVDQDKGLVFVFSFWDHNAILRSWQLTDGRTRNASRPGPWTWESLALFSIKDGLIRRVEAIVNEVPYGMKPGW